MRRALAALLALLVGCATNPVTGRPEVVLMSEGREASVGREAAAQVEAELGLVDDAALLALVRGVGARVAAHSPRKGVPFQFAVANMPETNAFALPGGYIYVSRGLLALVRSEDELANVLAHEVGHVAARHSAQRETRALGVGFLTLLGTLAAGAVGGSGAANTVGQLGQLAGAGLIASYGRDQERQADEVGQAMARAAGFDPGGMATFLAALDREAALHAGGKARRPSFLDSHPATPERVASTSTRARSLGGTAALPALSARAAFVSKLGGILVGADPAEGVIRGSAFLHPDLDLRVAFPEGWSLANGRAAVGAQEPKGAALLVLEGQERGDDPHAAAERFLAANAARLEGLEHGAFEAARVAAHRARGRVALQQGAAGVELFWFAQRGTIYRLQGLTGAADFARFAPAFERSAASFRGLSAEERGGIRERRVAIVRARGGETLAALGARSANVWKPEELALVNGVESGTALAAGQPVKVAVERPYAGRKE